MVLSEGGVAAAIAVRKIAGSYLFSSDLKQSNCGS